MSSPFVKAPWPPKHQDPKHQVEGFEALEKVEAWALTQVRSLKRGNRRHRRLAAALERCRPAHRCGVVPCQVCFRKFRRVAIGQIVVLLEGLGRSIYRASLVSAKWAIPVGELTSEKLHEIEQEVQEAISHSPLRNAVVWGAWDFTVHIDPRTDKAPYWQPHLYLVIATRKSVAVLDRVLLSLVERSDDVPIPKQLGSPASLWRTVNYSLKTKFKRRERHRNAKGDMDTKYDALRATERRELAVVLNDLGLLGRLFLRGIKLGGSTFKLDRGTSGDRPKRLLRSNLKDVGARTGRPSP